MREDVNKNQISINGIAALREKYISMVGKDVFVKELIRKDKYNEYGSKIISVNKNIICVQPHNSVVKKSILLTDVLIEKVFIILPEEI